MTHVQPTQRVRRQLAFRAALICGMIIASNAQATVWGLISDATLYSFRPTSLYRFAEDGSDLQMIGSVTLEGQEIEADALAVSPTQGLFAYNVWDPGSYYQSALLSVKPTTGEAVQIGDTLRYRRICGAAFDAQDRLWVLDDYQNELLQIDPATGAIVGDPVRLKWGSFNWAIYVGSDLCFLPDGSGYYVAYEGGSTGTRVFELASPESGQLTQLGVEEDLTLGGLVAVENVQGTSLLAYNTYSGGSIHKYAVPGLERSVVYDPIGPAHLGGFGDLAAVVPEPSTGMVLLLGAVLLRRRNSRA